MDAAYDADSIEDFYFMVGDKLQAVI